MRWRTEAREALHGMVADRLFEAGCTVELALLARLSDSELEVLVVLEAGGEPETVQARLALVS